MSSKRQHGDLLRSEVSGGVPNATIAPRRWRISPEGEAWIDAELVARAAADGKLAARFPRPPDEMNGDRLAQQAGDCPAPDARQWYVEQDYDYESSHVPPGERPLQPSDLLAYRRRFCCDGRCEQGRYCPESPAVTGEWGCVACAVAGAAATALLIGVISWMN